MLTFYGYNKCSTCRKAKNFLVDKNIDIKEFDITTSPPGRNTLQAIIRSGEYELKELFNRSGEMYRALNIKEKIKTMTEPQALSLLAKNGKLIKRPIITDGKRHTVGFDESILKKVWG